LRTKRPEIKKIPPEMTGRVSRGTRRYEDLIPRYLSVIQAVDEERYEMLLAMLFWKPEMTMDDEYWRSGAPDEDLDDLEWAMMAVCPDGCYFGEHPDVPADFGFWPTELAFRDEED